MEKLVTKRLGLAAYLKANGAEFVSWTEGEYTFKFPGNERTVDEWNLEYANSCCYRHDSELVLLRNLVRERQQWRSQVVHS